MTPIAQLEANLRAGGHTVRRALYMAAHGYATTDEPGNTDEDYRAWMQKMMKRACRGARTGVGKRKDTPFIYSHTAFNNWLRRQLREGEKCQQD